MVVEVHERLPSAAQAQLCGRLRDGLRSGFSGLYIEMDAARTLCSHGYEVEFADFERTARYDLNFRGFGIEGELECKSQSADAGRKIHRKDFYRLAELCRPHFESFNLGKPYVVVVTLSDRLSSVDSDQCALRDAVVAALRCKSDTKQSSNAFTVELEPFDRRFEHLPPRADVVFYAECRKIYGESCHVAGALRTDGGCILIARSQREDDASESTLNALRAAARQFSGTRPGFIAFQHEDIEPRHLALPHVRRRQALLDNHIFNSNDREHIAAICHSSFNGLTAVDDELFGLGFASWSPRWANQPGRYPFRELVLDDELTRITGANLPDSD